MRTLKSITLFLLWASLAFAQDVPPTPWKVPGLELPADMALPATKKFVVIEAKATGEVRFLIVGSGPVEYVQSGNAVVVASPDAGGFVSVYAVALTEVDGKPSMTEHARTQITVGGKPPGPTPPSPTPGPQPPAPSPIAGKIAVSVIEDPRLRTPEQAAVIHSAAVRQLVALPSIFRLYDINDPVIGEPSPQTPQANRLRTLLAKPEIKMVVDGKLTGPVLVVQDAAGVVRHWQPLPATEADMLGVLKKLMGQ